MANCQRLRTYRSRQASQECTLADAICATMAQNLWFSPIAAGNGVDRRDYAGVGYEFYSPARELLKESEICFGKEQRIACLLSLGCGQPSPKTDANESTAGIEAMLQSCESISKELQFRLSDNGVYHRLSSDIGTEGFDRMDLGDHVRESIGVDTGGYLEKKEISDVVDKVVEALRERKGCATLGQISTSFEV